MKGNRIYRISGLMNENLIGDNHQVDDGDDDDAGGGNNYDAGGDDDDDDDDKGASWKVNRIWWS